MNLVCRSIFALLAFYILYSECIKLPEIVKKNKTLFYFLIGGLYLYMYQNDQNDQVEGLGETEKTWIFATLAIVGVIIGFGWATNVFGESMSPAFAAGGLLVQALSTITDGNRTLGWMPVILGCWIAMANQAVFYAPKGKGGLAGFVLFILLLLSPVGWPGGPDALLRHLK